MGSQSTMSAQGTKTAAASDAVSIWPFTFTSSGKYLSSFSIGSQTEHHPLSHLDLRYYWLLVIFLFMLCSGGGWWFRFCRSSSGSRGNLTRTPTTSNPSRYSHSHPHPSNGGLHATSSLRSSATRPHHHYHHPHSDRQCPHHRHQMMQHQQRARILSHRPCGQRGSMYYLQRFWKSKALCLSW